MKKEDEVKLFGVNATFGVATFYPERAADYRSALRECVDSIADSAVKAERERRVSCPNCSALFVPETSQPEAREPDSTAELDRRVGEKLDEMLRYLTKADAVLEELRLARKVDPKSLSEPMAAPTPEPVPQEMGDVNQFSQLGDPQPGDECAACGHLYSAHRDMARRYWTPGLACGLLKSGFAGKS